MCNPPAVWRMFTAAVFHMGILHVAFNMMAFVPIGQSLERLLGTVQVRLYPAIESSRLPSIPCRCNSFTLAAHPAASSLGISAALQGEYFYLVVTYTGMDAHVLNIRIYGRQQP